MNFEWTFEWFIGNINEHYFWLMHFWLNRTYSYGVNCSVVFRLLWTTKWANYQIKIKSKLCVNQRKLLRELLYRSIECTSLGHPHSRLTLPWRTHQIVAYFWLSTSTSFIFLVMHVTKNNSKNVSLVCYSIIC